MPTWAALLMALSGLNLLTILATAFWFGVWKGQTDTTIVNHAARLDAHGRHLELHDAWMLEHAERVNQRRVG